MKKLSHLKQVEDLLTQVQLKVCVVGACHVVDKHQAIPLSLKAVSKQRGRVLLQWCAYINTSNMGNKLTSSIVNRQHVKIRVNIVLDSLTAWVLLCSSSVKLFRHLTAEKKVCGWILVTGSTCLEIHVKFKIFCCVLSCIIFKRSQISLQQFSKLRDQNNVKGKCGFVILSSPFPL